MPTTGAKKFKFRVDDRTLETDNEILTGAEIKRLAQVDPSFQLFLEVPGESRPDQQIGDNDPVNLSKPGIEKFYSVPPATFGLR
jgi:multiubiquitin